MTPLIQPSASRPALPEPQRERWQPLRLGLIELFHYDSEEFWFRDGHLLLRGNNGTGKSKVLSLTLPFLFDAQLRPSRIEPDGDNSKRMGWNLLMNSYQRRIGYTWIEFGRLQSNGSARYLTLGAGLLAVEGKPQVDSWYFLLEGTREGQDPRLGQDLWLTNNQRVVLTQKQLRELVEGKGYGTVFDNAPNYRRAVDERLFHLGSKRYEALMDTLIQLRQPQLARKPDENGLSHALTEALPPIPPELLGDVAEALNQLEEDREQLEKTRQLEHAIKQFEQRYRVYAGMLTRRQARELRQAQTAFDYASEERNKALNEFQKSEEAAAAASIAHEAAKRSLLGAQERRETLQSGPANQDANRLSQAEQDAQYRLAEVTTLGEKCDQANSNLAREQELSQQSNQRRIAAEDELNSTRAVCALEAESSGTAPSIAGNALMELPPDKLAELDATRFSSSASELREAAKKRRESVRYLERCHATLTDKQSRFNAAQDRQRERRDELEEARRRRAVADQEAEAAGTILVAAWTTHCAALKQLTFDSTESLEQLVTWTASPEGLNPMNTALAEAYAQASQRHAARHTELEARRNGLQRERAALIEERDRLAAGQDAVPLPPATRGEGVREGRVGAPLWQLVDFHPDVQAEQRAGLEASLEACGLLDAWIAPDGSITDASGSPLWDSQWLLRPTVHGASLADQLFPVDMESSNVAPHLVEALLASVACGAADNPSSESWVSVDGRYRLGALAGAWNKSEAVYIGQTARAQARQRRLEEIIRQLLALDEQDRVVANNFQVLFSEKTLANDERRGAPSDDAILKAVATAQSAEHAVVEVRVRLDSATAQCEKAEADFQAEREKLERDAADLHLPSTRDDLSLVASAVNRFADAYPLLIQAAQELRNAWLGLRQQQEREAEARSALLDRQEELAAASDRAETARVRYTVLYESIGAKVETLRQQLAQAADNVRRAEGDVDAKQKAMINAIEARGIASSTKDRAEEQLDNRTAVRFRAVERLQRFAESGLLASALPEFPVPDSGTPWTIDPALQLARRAEQALAHVSDDDATWTRIQRQISEDLTELQRSLSALGYQATSEPNDWGFTVHVLYQNRSERPDTLAAYLADDIAQRSELLSAKEREILENHLQAEIAAEIQRLMREADKQVIAINQELHKRPTSTGVRYRLQWQPLSSEEGAPLGLEIARERLLNTSSDLWSADDRRAVGTMLQQQITMERARAEADLSASGLSLIDQLARALDYRRWHRFRVQRKQDGEWRKLSGPASSGERALGLTVPLFAAVSSFYGRGGSPLAPRLMLLDEAFAGIDDAARAHCMGLIREFDLDFVMTSEREWACYAELPGVSICQLQRREGLDAVFVSRWIWDGRAKRREEDPDRRFPAHELNEVATQS
jgi:uncharacterized protein (TIGR02680 family)